MYSSYSCCQALYLVNIARMGDQEFVNFFIVGSPVSECMRLDDSFSRYTNVEDESLDILRGAFAYFHHQHHPGTLHLPEERLPVPVSS